VVGMVLGVLLLVFHKGLMCESGVCKEEDGSLAVPRCRDEAVIFRVSHRIGMLIGAAVRGSFGVGVCKFQIGTHFRVRGGAALME
jgi:hypothetical protein